MKVNKTVRGKAEALYRFAEDAGTPAVLEQREKELLEQGQMQAAEEYAQLWRIFCDVLDQFVALLGDTEVDGDDSDLPF